MQRYFFRALKTIVLLFILVALVFGLSYYLGRGSHPDITFMDLIRRSNIPMLVIFLVAFGFVYPMIGYVKQKIYASKPFDEYKQEVIRMFLQLNFVLVSDEDKKLVFRHKSAVARLMRLYEDTIVLDYSESPILLIGLRRDTYRLSRMVQHYIHNTEKED
ncbi:MAG: hypothetical protein LBH91_05195 [Prevotellaceae bacterium]|jgi:hypothetical protein|nr:hypothetical protein [Prevotellaceae bacterium]